MLHLLAIAARAYVAVCVPDLPVGTHCIIEGQVFQFRCVVVAPNVRHCDRRIKRSKQDVHL